MSIFKVLLLVLLLFDLPGCQRRGGLQQDDPLPAVSLTDFQGREVLLPQALKGKVWLLRFWSLECGFCDKDVLLGLETLHQKYKDRGFTPVAVNVGEFDPNDERLKRFVKLTYPMLLDERGLAAKKMGVIGLPTSFVIDRGGVLRGKMTGEAGLDEFEKLVATVLE